MLPYVIPDNPADPEAAALELLIRLPESYTDQIAQAAGQTVDTITTVITAFSPVMHTLATALSTAGSFREMSWHDAKLAAETISTYCYTTAEPGVAMLHHGLDTIGGRDRLHWDDKERASRAFGTASIAYATAAEPAVRNVIDAALDEINDARDGEAGRNEAGRG